MELIQLLLQSGASLEQPTSSSSPLSAAVSYRKHDAAQALIENGAQVDERVLNEVRSRDMADLVLPHADTAVLLRSKALRWACNGSPAVMNRIKRLVSTSFDVNASGPDGETALLSACSFRSAPLQMIEILLSNGANVAARGRGGATARALSQQEFRQCRPCTRGS